MIDAPLAVAFTAGLVATLNPCGFAMLPAYLSWHLSDDPASQTTTPNDDLVEARLARRLRRSLTVGGTVSAGFLVVFGATGALATAGARSIVDYASWAALVVGLLLAVLGIALLAGREVTIGLPKAQAGTQNRGPGAMLAFGASYAVASLSCTLPVFLAVVASTFTRTGLLTGTTTFLAYGAGMSLVLMTLTIALAFAKHTLVSRLRAATRHINRASGALLVLAGGYLVSYWAWNLTAEPGDTAGPVGALDDISTRASQWVQDLGWQATALALGAILTAALVAARTTTRPPTTADDCCPPDTNHPHTPRTGATIAPTATNCGPACDTTLDSPVRSNPYRPTMTTSPAPHARPPPMTPDELLARLDEITLVEALGDRQFEDMHLPGAVNLPASQVDDLAPERLPDKHAPIVVYCSNAACRNSGYVARRLADLGYTNVSTYPEGKQGWHQAGLPTESGPRIIPA